MAALGEREPAELGARRVEAMVSRHGAAVLRVANQFSLCHDDALDAYQRAFEIYLRRMETLDPATEGAWLRVVVKHEAMAIRRARLDSVDRDDLDLDENIHGGLREVDDAVAGGERVERSVEALRALKPDEARALLLKAEGPLLPGDRAALRVVLHEGQPVDHRGPRALSEDLQRDRGGRGVRAPRRDADGAGRRRGDRAATGRDPPASAPLRDLPRDGARDALLAVAADRAAAAVRLAGAAALAPGRHDDDVRRLQRRRAARAGGGDPRPVPERRRRGRGVRDDAARCRRRRSSPTSPRSPSERRHRRRRPSPWPRSREKGARRADLGPAPVHAAHPDARPPRRSRASRRPRSRAGRRRRPSRGRRPARRPRQEFGFEGAGSASGSASSGSSTGSGRVARAASVGGGGGGGGGGSTGSAPKGPTGKEFGFEGG